MPAGRGLASTSKAAKPPAGKTPAAKAPATAAKGPAPAPATKGKQAAAQHEGKAAAGKAAGKAKREMLAKVSRPLVEMVWINCALAGRCVRCTSAWPMLPWHARASCHCNTRPCFPCPTLLQFKHCGTTYEPGHTVYVVTDDSLVGRDLRCAHQRQEGDGMAAGARCPPARLPREQDRNERVADLLMSLSLSANSSLHTVALAPLLHWPTAVLSPAAELSPVAGLFNPLQRGRGRGLPLHGVRRHRHQAPSHAGVRPLPGRLPPGLLQPAAGRRAGGGREWGGVD